VLPESADVPPADLYVLAGDLPRALGELPSVALPGAGGRATADPALPECRRHITVFWPGPAPTLHIAPLADRLAQMREDLAHGHSLVDEGDDAYLAATLGAQQRENEVSVRANARSALCRS